VARSIDRQEPRAQLRDRVHHGLRLADGEAADRVAHETDGTRFLDGASAQGLGHATLHDPEERAPALAPPMRLEAADEPALRQAEGALGDRLARRLSETLVERVDDVGTQRVLDLDAELGGEEPERTVQMRAELDTLLADRAKPGQAPDLKATRVCQDRPVP